MIITPSILTGSMEEAQRQLDQLSGLAGCEKVQIDVVDGWYADNLTLTPIDLSQLEFYYLTADIHLMTQEPLDFVYEAQAALTKDLVGRVYGQIERMSQQADFIEWVKRCGWQPGLSLDLHTPLSAIDQNVWSDLNSIQIMGVAAGAQGQKFNASVIDLVQQTVDYIQTNNLNCQVVVDGGVTLTITSQLEKLKVNEVVIGSGLWQSPDIDQAWQNYQVNSNKSD